MCSTQLESVVMLLLLKIHLYSNCCRAIANYQEYLKQQRSESKKIDRGMQEKEDELESLLNNPDYQIKSFKGLKSQSKQTPKALGKYIAEGKEKLRDLRMTNYFADLAVRGGLVSMKKSYLPLTLNQRKLF